MANQDIVATEAFTLYESSDLNGSDNTRLARDNFSFSEEAVVQYGDYSYYPPFRANIVPTTYTVSFGGLFGYDEPSSNVRLTFSGEYPVVNATLYDVTNRPLNLTAINGQTIDLITFDVACADGTYSSLSVTIDDALYGMVHFAWPGTTPIGTHLARFTLWDDQTTDIPLLSIPTFPVTIEVRE